MPTLTPDDHVDYSKWSAFFNEETVFASTKVLEQMQKDIELELTARKLEKNDASS